MSDTPLELEFEIYALITSIEATFREIDEHMPADLSTTVRTVASGIDTLKRLADLALSTQNIDLREGLNQLREHLIEVKESLLEIREENLAFKEENLNLRKRIAELEQPTVEELIFKRFAYYTKEGSGPYCPSCYEKRKKKERLSVTGPVFICTECKYKGMMS